MADGFILAVTGGRDFEDSRVVFRALDRANSKVGGIALLVHGDATGADALAERWADEKGVPREKHFADWEQHGNAAGPKRNTAMAARRLDGCVAFPGGRGTADMVRRCRALGVPVWEVK